MTRSCDSCEWWAPIRRNVPGPFASDELIEVVEGGTCREGPEWADTEPDHWCGRWRVAERVINPEAKR